MKRILAIETSCDETAIALLGRDGSEVYHVLADQTLSQIDIHREYGGVFPALAKREHAKNILPILRTIFSATPHKGEITKLNAKQKSTLQEIFSHENGLADEIIDFFVECERPSIDVIAVTAGPGLEPALWVGVNIARALGLIWGIEVMPINHMAGHIASALVVKSGDTKEYKFAKPELPVAALLISGGHTEFALSEDLKSFKRIGMTRDDAVGESFDKVARLLDLPYPGGPEISRLAEASGNLKYPLPRPMIGSNDADMSFSGLKTAVRYLIRDLGELDQEKKVAIAKAFQNSVIDVLASKTNFILEKNNIKSFLVAGGVSANNRICEALEKTCVENDIMFAKPHKSLSTDNAIMIGVASQILSEKTLGGEEVIQLNADGNWEIDKKYENKSR